MGRVPLHDGAWGYNRDEKSYFKTPFRCLEILITQDELERQHAHEHRPDQPGLHLRPETEILDYYAHWMRLNGRSIYGCGAAPKSSLRLPPIAGTPTIKS